jgi:hypothetical protein
MVRIGRTSIEEAGATNEAAADRFFEAPLRPVAPDVDAYRKRAERAGVPFGLTSIPPMPEQCPCCSMKFTLWASSQAMSPSLDRFIPHLGYVDGNVGWLCMRCNRRKMNMELADVEKLLAYVRSVTPSSERASESVPRRRRARKMTPREGSALLPGSQGSLFDLEAS